MNNPICSKKQCTGCSTCFNICPMKCISMKIDEEGFFFPIIDIEKCIDCCKCKKVCPVINPVEFNNNIDVYACWNKDEDIRYKSSSGGVFFALATLVIEENGVVYGASYDDQMSVRHIAITDKDNIQKLQGSKYVQSNIGNVFMDIKKYLNNGRKVLFSGTPCQVAGLKNYIGTKDNDLITCDILCKGVPSPGVFKSYVNYLRETLIGNIRNINFRDKKYGWGNALTKISGEDKNELYAKGLLNSFMHGFDMGITVRYSCYQCQYTKINRVGDLTLGDFWGIGKEKPFLYSTHPGVSFVSINSKKGNEFFVKSSIYLNSIKRNLAEAVNGQGSAFSKPISMHSMRNEFFKDYYKMKYEQLADRYLVDKGLKGLLKKILPTFWIYKIRTILNSRIK